MLVSNEDFIWESWYWGEIQTTKMHAGFTSVIGPLDSGLCFHAKKFIYTNKLLINPVDEWIFYQMTSTKKCKIPLSPPPFVKIFWLVWILFGFYTQDPKTGKSLT